MVKALLTKTSDCYCRPDRLRLYHSHGQNLHLIDVSSNLRHTGLQKGDLDRRDRMRCVGHSCSLLPHISMPTFLWTLEPRGYFYGQVHRSAGLLPSSRILQHGT